MPKHKYDYDSEPAAAPIEPLTGLQCVLILRTAVNSVAYKNGFPKMPLTEARRIIQEQRQPITPIQLGDLIGNIINHQLTHI